MREKSIPFYQVLDRVKALHDEKGEGYEAPGDAAYPNYRRMTRWAKAIGQHPELAGSIYAIMRLEEKLERVRAILEGSDPGHETIEETLLDMGVIAPIALLLYQEAKSDAHRPRESESEREAVQSVS